MYIYNVLTNMAKITYRKTRFKVYLVLKELLKIHIRSALIIALIFNQISPVFAQNSFDPNHDGKINASDIAVLSASWRARVGDPRYNPDADLNNDGVINSSDLSILNLAWGASLSPPDIVGDINGDGKLDVQDIAALGTAYNRTARDPNFDPRVDLYHDGLINGLDINALSNLIQANTTLTPTATPAVSLPDLNSAEALRDRLIGLGYFTADAYNNLISSLSFDEVFSHFEFNGLAQLLIDQELIRSDIINPNMLFAHLLAGKSINITDWKLKPYGILSAIGDMRGEGSLFISTTTASNDRYKLMNTVEIKGKLADLFKTDPTQFIKYLSPTEFLKLLGAFVPTDMGPKPITAYTWNDLQTSNSDIVNPVHILDMSSGWDIFVPNEKTTIQDYLKNDFWVETPDQVADKLLAMPPGKRSVLIHSRTFALGVNRAGAPGGQEFEATIDPLTDAKGNVVVRNPTGVKMGPDGKDNVWYEPYYHFPSYTRWIQLMNLRLEPYLKAISQKVNIDYVILDYEERPNDFLDFAGSYQGHYGLLFQDPRMNEVLRKMNLTKTELMNQFNGTGQNTYWGSIINLKWNKYTEQVRAQAIHDAVFSVFEKYFPGITTSNWSNKLITELVPTGDYRNAGSSWGLGSHIPNSTMTNDAYGSQAYSYTPLGFVDPLVPPPHWIGEIISPTMYFTRFNALTTMLQEANTTTAASGIGTSHWVANPPYIDLYSDGLYGPNMKYDSTKGMYVSTDGKGGEGIGNAMAELWYRNSAQAETLNFYNSDFSRTFPGYNTHHDVFAERTITEVNELLGFKDRRVLEDGWVLVNGKRMSVGSVAAAFDVNPQIWAARANGKNIYRVIFKLENGETRENYLPANGETTSDVIFNSGSNEIRIPNASIYHPKDEVSKQGFWVVQDPAKIGLIYSSADVMLSALQNNIVFISGDINHDGKLDISDTQAIGTSWGLTSNDPGFNPDADLNHDGIINGRDISFLASLMVPPTIKGDINRDGKLDILDTQAISTSWGLTSNDPGFNPDADLNHDGIINGRDISFLASLMVPVQGDVSPNGSADTSLAAPTNSQTATTTSPSPSNINLNNTPAVRDRLIDLKYFTRADYDALVSSVTFDQVFSYFDNKTLAQLLIDQNMIRFDIKDVPTLFSHITAKGIDLNDWNLRPYGFLTAVGDVRGEGTLFANDLYRDREILMLTTNVKDKLVTLFSANHEQFVNLLPVNAFLDLLGATPADIAQIDPIFAHTWTALDTTNPYIVNPTKITYVSQWDQNNVADVNTTIDYYLGGYWATPIDSVVDSLLTKPEGERSILISSATYRWGSTRPGSPRGGVAPELDALQDANGHFVVRDPGDKSSEYWGVPYYYFPTRDLWVEVMKRRLDPFVKALKDKGATLDYVILDYEQRPGDFSEWLATYNGHYDLFFQDPRTADLLKKMGITKEQMMATTTQSFNTWWGTLVQLRWDKYVEDQRALAINEAFFEVFRKYFPNVAASNWSNNLVTDLVPLGDYRGGWGLGSHIPGTTTTNDSYGTQSPIFLPTNQYIEPSIMTPHWVLDPITEATHFTRFNALMTQINESNSISAASSTRTSNWVGNPAFVDLWLNGLYGTNMKYDAASGRYVSTDGKGGDGIGDTFAELWYRAAVEADVLNFYNSDYSRISPTYDVKHDVFGERSINEVNEMLGYSDRNILLNGWVFINGQRVSTSPSRVQFDASPLIWGARANGKNIYRLIFDIPKGQTREQYLVNDGSNGSDVVFKRDDKEIRIPYAHIYHPADEVSKQGFWVVQDPQKMGLIHNSVDTIMNAIQPKTQIPGDVNKDGVVNISDITTVSNQWMLTKNDSGFNPDIDLNHDGIINDLDMQIVKANWGRTSSTEILGDVNKDGVVNISDITTVSNQWMLTKNDPSFNPDIDLNHDGIINDLDMQIVKNNWGKTSVAVLPGDVNKDGVVDISDITMLSSVWLLTTKDAGFNPDADLNHDGIINGLDIQIVSANWGQESMLV